MTAHSREPCVHSMDDHPTKRAVVPNSQEHTEAKSKLQSNKSQVNLQHNVKS